MSGSMFACPVCGLEMRHQRNVTRHLRKQHPNARPTRHPHTRTAAPGSDTRTVKCLVPSCEKFFLTKPDMIHHVGSCELVSDCSGACVKRLSFPNAASFQNWKNYEETRILTRYTARSGNSRQLDDGNYVYYVCQGETRKGRACPARIFLQVQEQNLTATYFCYHSHNVVDVTSKTRLSDQELEFVRLELLNNSTTCKIVEKCRESLNCEISRTEVDKVRRELGLIDKVGPKGGDMDLFDWQDLYCTHATDLAPGNPTDDGDDDGESESEEESDVGVRLTRETEVVSESDTGQPSSRAPTGDRTQSPSFWRIKDKISQLSQLVETRSPSLNMKLTEAVLNSLLISAGVTETEVDAAESPNTSLISSIAESEGGNDTSPESLPSGRPIIVMKLPNLMLSL